MSPVKEDASIYAIVNHVSLRISLSEQISLKMKGGSIVGDLEFIFDNNQAINIGHFDFCDKCNQYKSIEGGETQAQDGLQLMWFCAECR